MHIYACFGMFWRYDVFSTRLWDNVMRNRSQTEAMQMCTDFSAIEYPNIC